uniref:Uncharacterized protein n=1 Tax=Macaca fascicularis TaxID=9541 RepID=A0A7N9D405_MACFA
MNHTWSKAIAQGLKSSQKEELKLVGLWGSLSHLKSYCCHLKRRPLWAPAPKTDKPGRMLLSSVSHMSRRKPVSLNEKENCEKPQAIQCLAGGLWCTCIPRRLESAKPVGNSLRPASHTWSMTAHPGS